LKKIYVIVPNKYLGYMQVLFIYSSKNGIICEAY
jgi:hypothetical protein